jgi:hypothetical protein
VSERERERERERALYLSSSTLNLYSMFQNTDVLLNSCTCNKDYALGLVRNDYFVLLGGPGRIILRYGSPFQFPQTFISKSSNTKTVLGRKK